MVEKHALHIHTKEMGKKREKKKRLVSE